MAGYQQMKLVVCGCSWSSRDETVPDTEFGSLVAKHYNLDYINLATVGASNFVIRNQIDYAINKLNADLVIVNWTTPCRIEWQYNDIEFDPTLSIENFDYTINPHNPLNRKPIVDCDPGFAFNSITTILDENTWDEWITSTMGEQGLPVTQEQFNSFKKYYLYWYDTRVELAKQIHYIKSAIYDFDKSDTLYLNGLNTLFFLQDQNLNYPEWKSLCNFIPDDNRIKGVAEMLQIHDKEMKGYIEYSDNPGCNLTYHISPDAQEYYFNNYIKPKLDNLL